MGFSNKRHTDNLLPQVVTQSNLYSAWERVLENHGCAGVDGVTIKGFHGSLESNLLCLALELNEGSYCPLPLMKIQVAKPNGEARALSIPCVRDRVAQASVLNVLEPFFEAEFEDCSFAYRKGHSVRHAILKVKEYYEAGYHWVLDADIDAFFDSVPHERLIRKVESIITDLRVLSLIRHWVEAEVWDGKRVSTIEKGIPQGSVISPLLANLYLDELDEELQARGIRLVRYADDFVVLCRTEEKAQEARLLTEETLRKMDLQLDEADVIHFDRGFRFLGVIFCRSTIMVPFDKDKKPRRVLDVPPPLNIKAYLASVKARR